LYLTAEDYEQAQSYSEQSLAITAQSKETSTNESLGPFEYSQARALHTLGQIDERYGSHTDALKKLGEALTLYERLNASASSYNIQIADVHIASARVYGSMGQYGKAFTSLTRAHQVSGNSEDQNTRAKIMSSQASLFLEQEDYPAAQKYFNLSLALYKWLGNATEEARVLLNLAVVEEQQGHHEEALQLFQRSMERAETVKLVDVQIAAGGGRSVVFTAKRDFKNALQANPDLGEARFLRALHYFWLVRLWVVVPVIVAPEVF